MFHVVCIVNVQLVQHLDVTVGQQAFHVVCIVNVQLVQHLDVMLCVL